MDSVLEKLKKNRLVRMACLLLEPEKARRVKICFPEYCGRAQMWSKLRETGHWQPEIVSTQKNGCKSGATQQGGDL